MNNGNRTLAMLRMGAASLLALALSQPVFAQAPAAPPAATPAPGVLPAIRMPSRGPVVKSPEILPDGRVTFRLLAPKATSVVIGGDIASSMLRSDQPPPPRPTQMPPPPLTMVKGTDGVWTGTTPTVVYPGAYRYAFDVDGARVIDPSTPLISPGQSSMNSMLVVPGDFSEQRNVPHGALATVDYEAKSYGPGVQRQLYVYTPPGYEKSTQRYPVLYLMHGGGDTAASWATIGRANFIMDNLIAEKKAVPFIIVMMSGWTPKGPQRETIDAANDPFNAEFVSDIMPMIEARYRVLATPANRAFSGLSMGGYQTLTVGMKNIDKFAYVLPMSTGWFTAGDTQRYIDANKAEIARADKQLKLFWWGYGKGDSARQNGLNAMDALRKAGLTRIETYETPFSHDWRTWRILLHEFAPKLFR